MLRLNPRSSSNKFWTGEDTRRSCRKVKNPKNYTPSTNSRDGDHAPEAGAAARGGGGATDSDSVSESDTTSNKFWKEEEMKPLLEDFVKRTHTFRDPNRIITIYDR
jgi:hypothetical protein